MTGEKITEELNYQLKSFLQNKLNWKDLNQLQKDTYPLISEGNDLLIIAPTASGKTESVLIPIYNKLLNERLPPTSTLYIAPLKALINDMYLRINYWNKSFGLTSTKWHGDINASIKKSYINNPTDFLLITPESLEVIFINKSKKEKIKIFENLKYIIIDEIHYFADSDRGVHLNSLLSRISKYTRNTIKIGLSATVGNPKDVSKWINTEKAVNIIKQTNKKNIQFKIVQYEENHEIPEFLSKYNSKKILLFVKSRKGVEYYYNILKKNFKEQNIFLHHASISKETRIKNEKKFRHSQNGIMVCTSTLELGIDIGNIDIVAQISTTNSISSLLQRIGRGGRRSNIQRVLFFIKSETEAILTLAQISLINKKIVENVNLRRKAKDIYLHQILSIIFEEKDIHFKDIYYRLNDCYSFSEITKDDFRNIIQHLIDTDIVENHNGRLSLGYGFEKEFGKINYIDFYSVFPSSSNYQIKNGNELVGELDYLGVIGLNENDTFVLAGKYWKITKKDIDKYVLYVIQTNKTDKIPNWNSSPFMLNYLTAQEVYNILLGNYDKSLLNYMSQKYSNYILKWNEDLKRHNLNKNSLPIIVKQSKNLNNICLCTFAGNYVNFLLVHLLSLNFDIKEINVYPIYVTFTTNSNVNDLTDYIKEFKNNFDTKFEVFISNITKNEITSKFIDYLPEEEKGDVIKEILFNIDDFKDLISKCEIKEVEYLDIRLLEF